MDDYSNKRRRLNMVQEPSARLVDDAHDTSHASSPGEQSSDCNATITEIDRHDFSRKKTPSRCRCRAREGSCRNCSCSKAGIGCNESCGCRDACDNNFNRFTQAHVDDWFGRSADGRPHKLPPCFVTELQLAPGWTFGQLTRNNLFKPLLRALHPELMENDQDIRKWKDQWDGLESMSKDPACDRALLCHRIVEMQRELLRMGILGPTSAGHFFSFCKGCWVADIITWHCPVCRKCSDWPEWYCIIYERRCVCGLSLPSRHSHPASDGHLVCPARRLPVR
ncbi:hypothetical protein F5Y10DRAFT_45390 [Nemania abortiva]|nr:hypothetical protein F5Y10DRAFT_45390 [Nemania abortiva]